MHRTARGYHRSQLADTALQAKAASGDEDLTVLADRGYFSGAEILACEQAGVTPYVPRPLTSSAKAEGRFGKQDFVYVAGKFNRVASDFCAEVQLRL